MAVGRVRAIGVRSDAPLVRGDVLLLPDEEEQAAARLHLRRNGHFADGSALNEAARAASAAAGVTWASAESRIDWSAAVSAEAEALPVGDQGEACAAIEERAPLNLSLSISSTAAAARQAAAAAATALNSADPVARALEAQFGRELSAAGLAGEGGARFGLGRAYDAYSQPFLLALEQALWREIVLCATLSARLETRGRGGAVEAEEEEAVAEEAEEEAEAEAVAEEADAWLDDEVLRRLPALREMLPLLPPPPESGWPADMPEPPSSAEWLSRFGYPPLRRAQRVSYLMAALLPELASVSALPAKLDRRALLPAGSPPPAPPSYTPFLEHSCRRAAADRVGARAAAGGGHAACGCLAVNGVS